MFFCCYFIVAAEEGGLTLRDDFLGWIVWTLGQTELKSLEPGSGKNIIQSTYSVGAR